MPDLYSTLTEEQIAQRVMCMLSDEENFDREGNATYCRICGLSSGQHRTAKSYYIYENGELFDDGSVSSVDNAYIRRGIELYGADNVILDPGRELPHD